MSTIPMVIISGPTSSGKSNFLHRIFEQGDIVINGDSRQMFCEYSIGVAKPNRELIQKYNYHCIDFLTLFTENNSVYFSSADFLKKVKSIIQKISSDKKVFIIGGSHFYLDVLKNGLPDNQNISCETKQKVNLLYQQKGLQAILEQLKKKDLEYYQIVDQKNHRRILRAMEYIEEYETPFSQYRQQRKPTNLNLLNLVVIFSRKKMISKIEQDVDYRLANGWIEEVEELQKKNIFLNHAIGYKQIGDYLHQKISLLDMTNQIKIKTLRFAKQQINWFKKKSFQGIFLCRDEIEQSQDPRDEWLQKIPKITLQELLSDNKKINEKKVRIKYNEGEAKEIIKFFYGR